MRAFGLVGLIIVVGIGFYIFNRSATGGPGAVASQERIDTVAIRQQLLVIGQTERQYQAAHGSYATLEQLAADGLLPGGTEQRGYVYTAVVNGSDHFAITAAPKDPAKTAWPTLEVTERMEVVER
jgi:hypothetical protein